MKGPWKAALAAAAIALAGVARAQPPEPEVEEEITVFESRILADLDAVPRRRGAWRPQDLVVLEDGIPRRVTTLQRLRQSDGLRIVLYFDVPLSRARTLRLASLQLGGQADALTALGEVEVIVADPQPRTYFGPSREGKLLAERLTELAATDLDADVLARSRKEFRAAAESMSPDDPLRLQALQAERRLVRERVDALLRLAAGGGGGDASVLFLVSDGFYPQPEAYYLGSDRIVDATLRGPGSPAVASRDLAETLAGYEWIVVAMPLREGSIEPKITERRSTDFERFIDHTGGVKMAPKAGEGEIDLPLEQLEVAVLPQLEPLREAARQSLGDTVRIVAQMPAAVARLGRLWRVYYLTDRELDGRLRPAAARVVRDNVEVPTPAWVRSSTPEPVAGLRARDALAARTREGELEFDLGWQPGGPGSVDVLDVSTRWGDLAEQVAGTWVRISVAYRQGDGSVAVGHTLVEVEEDVSGEAVWHREVRLRLPAGTKELAVAVEALLPRIWGATFLAR